MTLDADTEALIRRDMKRRGVSFKQALNDAIRCGGSDSGTAQPFETKVRSMGRPTVNLDKALQLAGELEDEEILRKMRLGK